MLCGTCWMRERLLRLEQFSHCVLWGQMNHLHQLPKFPSHCLLLPGQFSFWLFLLNGPLRKWVFVPSLQLSSPRLWQSLKQQTHYFGIHSSPARRQGKFPVESFLAVLIWSLPSPRSNVLFQPDILPLGSHCVWKYTPVLTFGIWTRWMYLSVDFREKCFINSRQPKYLTPLISSDTMKSDGPLFQ